MVTCTCGRPAIHSRDILVTLTVSCTGIPCQATVHGPMLECRYLGLVQIVGNHSSASDQWDVFVVNLTVNLHRRIYCPCFTFVFQLLQMSLKLLESLVISHQRLTYTFFSLSLCLPYTMGENLCHSIWHQCLIHYNAFINKKTLNVWHMELLSVSFSILSSVNEP